MEKRLVAVGEVSMADGRKRANEGRVMGKDSFVQRGSVVEACRVINVTDQGTGNEASGPWVRDGEEDDDEVFVSTGAPGQQDEGRDQGQKGGREAAERKEPMAGLTCGDRNGRRED